MHRLYNTALTPTVLIALVAIALAGRAPLGAQTTATPTVEATVDRAVRAYEGMKSVRATFEQTMVNPLTGKSLVSRGEFLRRSPDLVSVRFTDPEGDRIVADGKSLWIYLPSTNPGQVIRMPLDASGTGTLDLTAQFLDSPWERYRITDGGTESVGDRDMRKLTLVPKSAGNLPFTSAIVWVDNGDGTIRQFEVTNAMGLTRRVRLLTLEPNAAIDRSAFTFTPPEGVEVFDRTGM